VQERAVFALGAVVAASLVVASLAGASARVSQRDAESSGLIAFARANGIYVMRADGSGVRALRRGGAASGGVAGLAWSPDGSRLAFVTGAHGNLLWVMDADGSNLARLVLRAGNAESPTWSPDGRKIAFTAYRHGRAVWVMNADGTDQRPLALPGRCAIDVDWSPAGERIAFDECQGLDVYVTRPDGGGARNLTPGRFQAFGPHWAPDGRRIAFTRWRGSMLGGDIYVTDAVGHSRIRLTHGSRDSAPAWSPDGKRIAFVRAVPSGAPAPPEIFVMNADGSGVTRLTHNGVAEASPAWQPVFPS
jgi:TolB protein